LPSAAEASSELGGRAVGLHSSVLLRSQRRIEACAAAPDLASALATPLRPSTTKMTASPRRSPAPLARHPKKMPSAGRLQPTGVDGDERRSPARPP